MPTSFPTDQVMLIAAAALAIGYLIRHKGLFVIGGKQPAQPVQTAAPTVAAMPAKQIPAVEPSGDPAARSAYHTMQLVNAQQQMHVEERKRTAEREATQAIMAANQAFLAKPAA